MVEEINKNKAETPRERFVRLATQRTNEVLKRLRVLGNCSNRSAYEYEEKDVEKIFGEIDKKAKEVKSKFQQSKHREFKL